LASKIETVAASICLFLYEQTACTVEQAGAWKKLFGGSSYLIKQRGPAAFKAFPDHHMFVRLYRNSAIFDAMSRRKSTFLADPEWCTVPWENIPKSPMDHLFDIMVQLPNIFERAERLHNYPPSIARTLKAKDLLHNCTYVDNQFAKWYNELHESAEGPLFWTKPKHQEYDRQGYSEADSAFLEIFEFTTLRVSLLHMYYWSSLCLFYRTVQQIHTVLFPTQSGSSTPIPGFYNNSPFTQQESSTSTYHAQGSPSSHFPGPQIESLNPKFQDSAIEVFAGNICRSLEYGLNETTSFIGPDCCAFPLWNALQFYCKYPGPELDWCGKMLDRLKEAGFAFAREMGKVRWKEYE